MVSRQYGAPREEDKLKGSKNTEPPEPPPVDRKPDAKTVEDFHTNADTDNSDTAIHHTLGNSPQQAAPGSHNHDGGSSVLLLEGMTLTGNKANPATMWPSIIQGLTRLGMKDATT